MVSFPQKLKQKHSNLIILNPLNQISQACVKHIIKLLISYLECVIDTEWLDMWILIKPNETPWSFNTEP